MEGGCSRVRNRVPLYRVRDKETKESLRVQRATASWNKDNNDAVLGTTAIMHGINNIAGNDSGTIIKTKANSQHEWMVRIHGFYSLGTNTRLIQYWS